MKYYKLTDQELRTHNGFQWEVGKKYTIEKPGTKMCSDQVFHCYSHPVLAVILNPVHANIKNPRMFEVEVDEIVAGDGLKFASKAQTLVSEIALPELSTVQKVDFAIRVALKVYKDEGFEKWAASYLDRSDTSEAAVSAAGAAERAAEAAERAAE